MTDRIDKALALARDLQRMTLHGPPPLATTMEIAAGLVEAVAALATSKDEERAAVVAYLRSTAPYQWPCSPEPEVCADAIESNRHRGHP